MKILHTSDWHLGRKPVGGVGKFSDIRFNDYFESARWVVEKAIEEKIDLILISGDLFDKSNILPEVFDRTIEILQMAKENGIKIFAVEGNHDRVFQSYSWLKSLDKMGYLKLLDYKNDGMYEFEGYNFYGLPYNGLPEEYFKESLKNIETKSNNIFVIHTAINSSDYLIPGIISKEQADRLGEKFDYIAGGHFHYYSFYPQKSPFFFVPGSPEYCDLYERDEKGIIIYDTEKSKHTFIPSKKRKVHRLTLELRNNDELLEEVKKLTHKNSVNEEDILILNIKASDTYNYISVEELENDLSKEIRALKIIIVGIDYYGENVISVSDITKNKIEEIEKSVITQKWKNIFSFNAEKTVKFTEELKRIVIDQRDESEIYEITDKFLSSLLGDSGNVD